VPLINELRAVVRKQESKSGAFVINPNMNANFRMARDPLKD
jgi:hypothetical protein